MTQEQAEVTAVSKLIRITRFPTKYASKLEILEKTLPQLHDLILQTSAPSKFQLPWLKLAIFSGKINPENPPGQSLRYDKGVVSISGVEGDVDDAPLTFEEACAKLRAAKLAALLYTTASPGHFRVLCPASCERPPEERSKLTGRLNGVLGGALSFESFTLSQSYYYGSVRGSPPLRVEIIEGDFIDLRDDLDAGAIFPPRNEKLSRSLTDVVGIAPEQPITSLEDSRLRSLPPDIRHMIVTATPPPDRPHLKGGRGHCRVVLELVRLGLNNAQIKSVYRLGKISHGPSGCPRGFDDYLDRVIALYRPVYESEVLAAEFTEKFLAKVAAKLAEEKTKSPRGLRLIPFDEIRLGNERRYLVKGLIPREGLIVVWGPPKCGKSFWAFDLTMHIALGWEYRSRRVQQAPVVYCAFEGQRGFEARVEAFRQRFLQEYEEKIPFLP
jgi:hypothetical protein